MIRRKGRRDYGTERPSNVLIVSQHDRFLFFGAVIRILDHGAVVSPFFFLLFFLLLFFSLLSAVFQHLAYAFES